MIANSALRINEKLTNSESSSILDVVKKKFIPKKRVSDIRKEKLQEPALSDTERSLLEEGIRLFNARRFWDAHETWEAVWRQREEESRIFFQGIIQAAAGFHLIAERPRPGGAAKNLKKALEKLDLFPDQFLGLEVALLRKSIRKALNTLDSAQGQEAKGEIVEIPVLLKAGGLEPRSRTSSRISP